MVRQLGALTRHLAAVPRSGPLLGSNIGFGCKVLKSICWGRPKPLVSKPCVPAVYLTLAISLFVPFFSLNEINKLRVISRAQNSDSPRLHHSQILPCRAGDAWVCGQTSEDCPGSYSLGHSNGKSFPASCGLRLTPSVSAARARTGSSHWPGPPPSAEQSHPGERPSVRGSFRRP